MTNDIPVLDFWSALRFKARVDPRLHGTATADLLVARMRAKPLQPMYLQTDP